MRVYMIVSKRLDDCSGASDRYFTRFNMFGVPMWGGALYAVSGAAEFKTEAEAEATLAKIKAKTPTPPAGREYVVA